MSGKNNNSGFETNSIGLKRDFIDMITDLSSDDKENSNTSYLDKMDESNSPPTNHIDTKKQVTNNNNPSIESKKIDEDNMLDDYEVIHVNEEKQSQQHHHQQQQIVAGQQPGLDAIGVDDDDDESDEDSDSDVDDESDIIEVDPQSVSTTSNNQKKTQQLPSADNHKALATRLLKPVPDYPVKTENFNIWQIKDWYGLPKDKVRGPAFTCDDFSWNILLFPKGNNNNLISIYIEPQPLDKRSEWYVCAQFYLDIWNPLHPDSHTVMSSHHRFSNNETDWGFTAFMDSKQLSSIQRSHQYPILENNQLNITAYVKVIDDSSTGVLWHNLVDYDSKSNTGFVGLGNQGATCYLNSLLQSYFTTKCFRKLVYQIPTDSDSNNNNNKAVPLALQRIFYSLATSNDAVNTLELTKSFGWDSSDAFTQHDVQELNRILMDKLESAMKGTSIENSLNDIFVGKMKSYIKCVNVPYESSRVEDFWDIQLNVKGFDKLEQAFANYIEIEMLEGENKYQAGDEYGYQDAKKGVVFQSYPPVLHLQLKRFEYDFMVDDLVKIDDLYEFPDKIDLKPYLDEEVSDEVKNQNWNYKLHGVLVHQGSISNGHYYAMIKPNANDNTWLRFDDDKVWKVTPTQVFQENFGHDELSSDQLSRLSRLEQNQYFTSRVTSAYMLVYYRELELENILPIDENKINSYVPEHIPKQIQDERDELERLEKARQEALYYLNVKFVTVENYNNFNGFDMYPDPTVSKFYDDNIFNEKSYPVQLKVKKDDPFSSLYELAAKEFNYQIEESNKEDLSKYPFRLILVNHRNNHTNRADAPVPTEFQSLTISQICNRFFNKRYDEMVFYIEEAHKELKSVNESHSSIEEEISPEQFSFDKVFSKINSSTDVKNNELQDISEGSSFIQIYLKYFDLVSNEVRGLTHVTVSKDDTLLSLIKPVNKLLGFDEKTPLEIFEELSQVKIENVDINSTFEKNELSTGDILVFQVANVENGTLGKKFANIKEYYKFLLTRLHIFVKPFKASTGDEDSDFVAEDDDEKQDKSAELQNKTGSGKSPQEAREIELAKEISKSFDLWISTQYSYQDLAINIAKKIDSELDPNYLRLFIVNNQGVRYPLKSSHNLLQFFPKSVSLSSITNFEYEILNITLKEYENMKSVKVYWLNSICHFQLFDFLLPKDGTATDLVNKLVHKLNIPQKDLTNLLLYAGFENKYIDLIKFDRTIESIHDEYELYAGIFPAEVEILASHDLIKRFTNTPPKPDEIDDEITKDEYLKTVNYSKHLNIIPVFHFYKTINNQHGNPFLFPLFPSEPFSETKDRLRKKLGLGVQAFEKIKIALADNNAKGRFIDQENLDLNLFQEVATFASSVSLALDHPDRAPRRVNPFDKGISIK